MKAIFFAVSTLSVATLASARVSNKARATTSDRQAFELDVTTTKYGLKDYYSREDGYIFVSVEEDDTLKGAVVRSVKDDVTCTISGPNGQIRKIGGEFPDSYERESWETEHVISVGCFFQDESADESADGDVSQTSTPKRQVSQPAEESTASTRRPFEMDITYEQAGLQDFYSREDGFINESLLTGDRVLSAVVRSVDDDVVCTIRDANNYQVRKYGGEHPDSIELGEYESKVATSVNCVYEDAL